MHTKGLSCVKKYIFARQVHIRKQDMYWLNNVGLDYIMLCSIIESTACRIFRKKHNQNTSSEMLTPMRLKVMKLQNNINGSVVD